MFERITEAEINERSMANVSTTPGRRTAFGEGGLDAKALKLRFDRLGRYLAKRLNEVFDGIADGSLAEVLYIDSEGEKRSLKDFVDSLLTGQVESIKIQTSDGVITLTELGDRTQEMYNGLDTGDLAGKIKIIEGVTLKKFYEDFLKFEGNTAPVRSVNGKTGEVKLSAEDVGARPDSWMPTASEVGARPNDWMPTASEVGARPNDWMPTASEVGARPNDWMPTFEEIDAEKAGSAAIAVSGHNVQTDAHNDIRIELQRLAGIIADILDSDDATLDEMHEVVAYIKSNKALIEAVTTSKVNVVDIINNLTTNVSDKPLSASQGVALKTLIDALDTNKLNASALTNAINIALAQAKESGEFVGDKGDKGDGLEIVITTGHSKAYKATVKGITELKPGASFIMIPHITCSPGSITLNVNELGAKTLYRGGTDSISLFDGGYQWLRIGQPYRVMYTNAYWLVTDLPKVIADDLYGRVPVDNGGVPSTNADNKGKVLTTNENGTPEWQEPSGGGESMLGEWVFNDEITPTDGILYVDFECCGFQYEKIELHTYGDGIATMIYGNTLAYDDVWEDEYFKLINILTEPSAEDAAWIKAHAKRKQPVGVDKIGEIYTTEGDFTFVDVNKGSSIIWSQIFGLYDKNGNTIGSGFIGQGIPIAAGENVTFEVDEESKVVKINATGGGSSNTDDSMIGIWEFNETITTPLTICDTPETLVYWDSEGYFFQFEAYQIYDDGTQVPITYIECVLANGELYDHVYDNVVIANTDSGDLYTSTDGWFGSRKILITKEPHDANVAAWVRANAKKQGGSSSGSDIFPLPRIRFANFTEYKNEEDMTMYRFTVENLGGGTLQAGDKLQICCRRKYPGGKKKLRRMIEYEITEEDINQRFLKIEVDPNDELDHKWLFRNDRVGSHSTLSAMYFRLKRVTKYSDEDGKECDAIFSNVETVWKAFYMVEDEDGKKYSLKIK